MENNTVAVEKIPTEIWLKIFLMLDTHSIRYTAKLVCKRWNAIIKGDPSISSHVMIKNQSMNLETNKMKAFIKGYPNLKRLEFYDFTANFNFDELDLKQISSLEKVVITRISSLQSIGQDYNKVHDSYKDMSFACPVMDVKSISFHPGENLNELDVNNINSMTVNGLLTDEIGIFGSPRICHGMDQYFKQFGTIMKNNLENLTIIEENFRFGTTKGQIIESRLFALLSGMPKLKSLVLEFDIESDRIIPQYLQEVCPQITKFGLNYGSIFDACTGKVRPDEYDIIDVILTFFTNLKELRITCGRWYDKFTLRSQPYHSMKKLYLSGLYLCNSEVKGEHLEEIITIFPNLEVLNGVVINNPGNQKPCLRMVTHMETLSKLTKLRSLKLFERYNTLYCDISDSVYYDLMSAMQVIHTDFNINAEVEIDLKFPRSYGKVLTKEIGDVPKLMPSLISDIGDVKTFIERFETKFPDLSRKLEHDIISHLFNMWPIDGNGREAANMDANANYELSLKEAGAIDVKKDANERITLNTEDVSNDSIFKNNNFDDMDIKEDAKVNAIEKMEVDANNGSNKDQRKKRKKKQNHPQVTNTNVQETMKLNVKKGTNESAIENVTVRKKENIDGNINFVDLNQTLSKKERPKENFPNGNANFDVKEGNELGLNYYRPSTFPLCYSAKLGLNYYDNFKQSEENTKRGRKNKKLLPKKDVDRTVHDAKEELNIKGTTEKLVVNEYGGLSKKARKKKNSATENFEYGTKVFWNTNGKGRKKNDVVEDNFKTGVDETIDEKAQGRKNLISYVRNMRL